MCSDARDDRKRPNDYNCSWLLSIVGQKVEPQSEHGRQREQTTNAERTSLAILLLYTCVFVFDVVRHGYIIVLTTQPG